MCRSLDGESKQEGGAAERPVAERLSATGSEGDRPSLEMFLRWAKADLVMGLIWE